jgi:hypothetical protein
VIIGARGPIIPGDYQRLRAFFQTMPSTDRIIGMAIDSPGGNVLEADDIAAVVRSANLPVIVTTGSECSSACFLIFAAASHRFVGADALIGVHSAEENGKETPGSMALATAMAREAAEFGVPAAIIGKLVQTPPERATWLTPADLASMGATVLDPANSRPPPQYAPPSVIPPSQHYGSSNPLRPPSTDQQPISKSYEEGAADRRSWEAWFGGLTGAYQAGAEYWAEQRSTPAPGSCYGPAGQNLGDWTTGCLVAKRILTPSDVRRKSEHDYYAGWNSY